MRLFFKENSPLYNLPIGLEPKNLKKLDSLRFTLEIIEYCYENLIKDLFELAYQKNNRNYPKIFLA